MAGVPRLGGSLNKKSVVAVVVVGITSKPRKLAGGEMAIFCVG